MGVEMARNKVIEEQTRHNTKEEIQRKKLAEDSVWVGDEELDNIPNWLRNKIAVSEWERLVKEFRKKQLISNLDYNNLGAYCNAFSSYVELEEEIKEDGIIWGNKPNPFLVIQQKFSEEMRKFAQLLGLSIQSRLQAGGKVVSKTENELGGEFGDI